MASPHPVAPSTLSTTRRTRTTSGPSSPDELARLLAEAAAGRRAQLERLPHDPSPVAAAHRASVERILAAICTAQERLVAGTYDTCSGCGRRIDADQTRRCPWTTTCGSCGGR